MPSQVATYQLDDSTTVSFEIGPADGFRPAGPGHIAGKVRDAVGPAVEAAREVLDKVKQLAPSEVEVTFGIKVSGDANWIIARAAADASFEVTLTWSPKDKPLSRQKAPRNPAPVSRTTTAPNHPPDDPAQP